MANRIRHSEAQALRQRERLGESGVWSPVPAMMIFGFALLVTVQTLFSLNKHLGHPTDVLPFDATETDGGGIWLTLTLDGEDIVVTTETRQIIRIKADETQELVKYLKNEVDKRIKGAVMANRAATNEVRATIAADQRTKFTHLRPVLYALAEARITRYEIETRILR